MGGLRLFGLAVALATVIGSFSTVVLKVASDRAGGTLTWAGAATGWIDWYLWAALTPLVVWLARSIPVTGRTWPRAVATHVLLGLAVSAVELAVYAVAMGAYWQLVADAPLAPYGPRYLSLIGRWLPLQTLIYALIVAVVNAVDHGRRAGEREVATARLETELARTQVHALQAQMQPHFLFNTLNTIAMAVREGRSDAAVEMMAQLSAILRHTMEATVRPETTLRKELAFVREFVRLERFRLEDRLSVEWVVADEALDARVPTMLLQPLVENAIRHGIADSAAGGTVRVRADRRGDDLVLRVEDTGVGVAAEPAEGVGIGNTRRRMWVQYGADSSLTLTPRLGGGTVACAILPYRTESERSFHGR